MVVREAGGLAVRVRFPAARPNKKGRIIFSLFYLVAITERSANLFRATISALTCRNPAQRFRSPDGEQNRKIFSTSFNGTPPKFFSIKETKIFLFCLPADAGIAETLSHPR